MFRLIILSLIVIGGKSEPSIQTKFGQIEGKWMLSSRNSLIDAYLGLPYAKPPVNDLRFKNPQIWEEEWTETRDATKNGPTCIQIDDNSEIIGEEDCLYLNVFVHRDTRDPTTSTDEPQKKLPVLVFIRGGSFNVGTTNSSIFSPIYLLNEKIVLVTFNYRLNFLGFYSTGNEVSPGNYGLKDMVTALKWVKENIADFGGDPDSITLFGNSAGAAAIHYLALTNKTEGLFHKMITMSGSALAPWAFNPPKMIRENSIQLAKLADCFQWNETVLQQNETTLSYNETDEVYEENNEVGNTTINMTDEEIVDCMRNADAEKLLNLTKKLAVWRNLPTMFFGPTLEEDNEDAILTVHPRKAVENALYRDIPWIMGVVSDESLGFGVTSDDEFLNELTDNFTEIIPYLLECNKVVEKKEQFAEALIDYYFQGNISSDYPTNATEMYGDATIYWPTYEALQKQGMAMNSSIFFYHFAYEGTFSVTMDEKGDRIPGVAHMDDLNYLFPFLNNIHADLQLNNTSDDMTMINIMTELWANFAKTGKPSAQFIFTEWKPYQEDQKFMRLGNGNSATISTESDFLAEIMLFWEPLMKDVSYPLEDSIIVTNETDNNNNNNSNNNGTSDNNDTGSAYSIHGFHIICLIFVSLLYFT